MNKHLVLTLKIILSLIILIYLFTIIPIQNIWISIQSAEIIFILLGLILASPISYLSAFETQYLTKIQGMSLSVFEILKIQLATSFYGLFLPGTLSGGAIKWYKFSKHGTKSSAAAVVVFNRFLEILIIILLGIFFSLPSLYALKNKTLIALWVLIFFFMILLYYFLLNKSALILIEKIVLRLPLLRNSSGFKEKVHKIIDAMHQFQNLSLRNHVEIIGLMLLYHGIGVLSFYCFARSLNIDVNLWVIGWVRSAMTIAIMLPLSFAGLGIREGTLVLLLGQYGVLPSNSMALSFLFLFRAILTSLMGGLFEFKDFAFSKKKKEIGSVERIDDK
jgi:uncharacterized protein (TIRG00374 family)